MSKTPRHVVKVTSLEDIDTLLPDVEVERIDGSFLSIPIREIGYAEFVRLGLAIRNPSPPIAGVDPVTKKPLLDYNNPDYLAAVNEAGMKRQYARLIPMLRFDVPGDTLDDKIVALDRRLGFAETRQLIGWMNAMAERMEAAIQTRADTFHVNGAGGTPDRDGAGLDAGDVLDAE